MSRNCWLVGATLNTSQSLFSYHLPSVFSTTHSWLKLYSFFYCCQLWPYPCRDDFRCNPTLRLYMIYFNLKVVLVRLSFNGAWFLSFINLSILIFGVFNLHVSWLIDKHAHVSVCLWSKPLNLTGFLILNGSHPRLQRLLHSLQYMARSCSTLSTFTMKIIPVFYSERSHRGTVCVSERYFSVQFNAVWMDNHSCFSSVKTGKNNNIVLLISRRFGFWASSIVSLCQKLCSLLSRKCQTRNFRQNKT